jgi:hypothetical protein
MTRLARCLSVVSIAVGVASSPGCVHEPAGLARAVTASEPIVIDAAEAERLIPFAIRQGPVEAPVVESIPCAMRPSGRDDLVVVETIVSEEGRIVWARIVSGDTTSSAVEHLRSCLERARLTPATMNGRPIPVHFNMTVSTRQQEGG